MTNNEYLIKLVSILTEDQLSLFNRMYPEWPSKSQTKLAIVQAETTLMKLNETNSKLRHENIELKESILKKSSSLIEYENDLDDIKSDLKEAYKTIERLKNPINIENSVVQERLELLAALEAGGVDNWEWYDESIDRHMNND